MKLSVAVVGYLRTTCEAFAAVPVEDRADRGAAKRDRAMEKIECAAKALLEHLESLPSREIGALESALSRAEAPRAGGAVYARVAAAQRGVLHLGLAARKVREGLPRGRRAGVGKSQGFRVRFVLEIARCVKDAGIAPNRSAKAAGDPCPFLEICRACFAAVSLRGGPEAAIQRFLQTDRAADRAAGRCL